MPLAFTSEPARVGEASRPLAAPFWAGSAPRTPPRADAVDADADADYISRGAGRSPSSLSPIPEETSGGKPTPAERRRLSPTYEAGTPPPEGMDGPDARKALDSAIREGASIAVPSPEPDDEIARLTASPSKSDDMTDEAFVRKVAERAAQRGLDVYTPPDTVEKPSKKTPSPSHKKKSLWSALRGAVARHEAPLLDETEELAEDEKKRVFGRRASQRRASVTRDGLVKRHASGPDPWDEACSKARRSLQKKLSASEDRRRLSDVVVEYHRTVRGVVVDYVSAVEKLGLVYRVEFVEEGPLHFQIALARYGEQGRRFVVVESVARQCVGRAQIKPTDELVAVNGKVIVEPTSKDRLTELLRTIAAAPRPLTLTFVEGEDREKHAAPPPPSPLNAVLAFGGWRTVRPEPRRLVRMPAPPQSYYGRRRCALAAAVAFVLCGAVPAPRKTPPPPPPQKEFPWVPVVVAGAGAVALARPEVRAGRALASLGRGVVIGAFPA